MSYVSTEQLQAEIDEMANEIIDALMRKAQDYRVYSDMPNINIGNSHNKIINMVDLMGLAPLNTYEATIIDALAYVVSKEKSIDKTDVIDQLKQKMHVAHIEQICRADYGRATRYLADMLARQPSEN